MRAFLAVLALAAPIAACAAPPAAPAVQLSAQTASAGPRYKEVLVAGDGSLPVFDNAVSALAAKLGSEAGTQRLSADPAADGVRPATLGHVLEAVADMHPAPGEGCLVFATSHGASGRGLFLSASQDMLSPAALDRALVRGCGAAPTVVVISGCFSGAFAQPPMARPNRVILTAARADRPSFGCGAGRTYTVYDRCLLDALQPGVPWTQVHAAVRRCVATEEREGDFDPSQPQAFFGSAVPGLVVPRPD